MKYRQFWKSFFEIHGHRYQLLLGVESLLGIHLEGILVCFNLSGETLMKASPLKSFDIKCQVCTVLWNTLYLWRGYKVCKSE